MGHVARKLDPPPVARKADSSSSAAERRAWLLSLPLSETPATDEEIALFVQGEEDLRLLGAAAARLASSAFAKR